MREINWDVKGQRLDAVAEGGSLSLGKRELFIYLVGELELGRNSSWAGLLLGTRSQ